MRTGDLGASLSADDADKPAESNGPTLGGERVVAPPTIAREPESQQDGPIGPRGATGPASGQQRTVQIPYSRSNWALLQAEFPMSQAQWEQMLAVLDVMKPSLVED